MFITVQRRNGALSSPLHGDVRHSGYTTDNETLFAVMPTFYNVMVSKLLNYASYVCGLGN